jgi:hypothetical protein
MKAESAKAAAGGKFSEPISRSRHRIGMTEYWLVLRQDDNGNVFVMAEYASEAAARAEAQVLEARAHKQMYWIEPRGDRPPKDASAR